MKNLSLKTILFMMATMLIATSFFSCAKKEAKQEEMPDELAFLQQAEKPATIEYKETGEAVTGASCNNLASTVGNVTIVVDKDISKAEPVPVNGANVSVVEYLGEKCLRITPNFNPEIRVAFVLDTPTTVGDIKTLKFSVAGFNGGSGAYNCGLMYDTMNGNEHAASFYLSDIKADAWTDVTADLATMEQWGANFGTDKTIIAIQFWSGDKGPLYIKGLELAK